MAWTRERILARLKRAAHDNAGEPPGQHAFNKLVPESAWRGTFWARYSDLVCEAGFEARPPTRAHDPVALLQGFVVLIRKLRHFPTRAEQRVERRSNPDFPSPGTLATRFGSQDQLAAAVHEFCSKREDLADVETILDLGRGPQAADSAGVASAAPTGYVYLIKSGRYFKIGRAKHIGRRDYEIGLQLPEPHKAIHYFETDDPAGIEAYWHRRFEEKRRGGEWFDLSKADVEAFKRRKKFM